MRNSNMRNFLVTLFGIFVLVLVLLLANDIICSAMVFASTGSSQYKMYRLFNERPQGEIAIVGSSRAQANFVPKLLGDNVFNYGLDGAGMSETALHLHALITRGNARLIIVNLDPWGIVWNKLKGDYSLATRREDVETAIEKLPPLDYFSCPGVRFWGKFRPIVTTWFNARISGTKHIELGSILQRSTRTSSEWAVINERFPIQSFCIDEAILSDLENLLAAPHPPIAFVVSPVLKEWYERFSEEGANTRGFESLKRRFAIFPNVWVFDMMTENLEGFSNDDFFDPTHLNEKGAIKFSKEIAAILRRLLI